MLYKSSIIEKHQLQAIVKDVLLFNGLENGLTEERLSFFADGYPGIVLLQSEVPALMLPKGKTLTPFFIYGQTVQPLEIQFKGNYRMLVFQLQPFAVRILFGVDPRHLNDDCHDLSISFSDTLKALEDSADTDELIEILAKFIVKTAETANIEKDNQIQMAIGLVLANGGKITVKSLSQQLHLTERTLQRLFMQYVGLSPKQFAKIVQFQQAFNQISDEAFDKLSEIVFENGYADQSHFIRNFRRFTGSKPSDFRGA